MRQIKLHKYDKYCIYENCVDSGYSDVDYYRTSPQI